MLGILFWCDMDISALCNHLRHPLTYTDAQGKPQLLSLEEVGQVTLFVLSSMAVAIFEAITSQRSLKWSCVSIVIITGSSFYLATAILKMASRGNGSSRPGEDLLRKKMDPVTQTLQVSVIGSPVKSEWHVVDPPRSDKEESKQPVSRMVEVSVIGSPYKTEWTCVPSELQETTIVPVTTTVNRAGSPRKEQKTKLQTHQDEIMQISVMGSPNKTLEDPTISPISTQDRPVVTAEAKKDKDDKEKEQKEPDLTVSVFGPEVKDWTSLTSNASLSYYELPVSDDHIKVIAEMIHTIGDTYLPFLYFKKTELIQMGKKIENVHPLKFLETILNNPAIKKSMLDIKGSGLKWGGFLSGDSASPGFMAKCQREDDLGNFAPYIIDFCQAVKVDAQKVRVFYEAKEWKELIEFLIDS